MPHMYKEWYTPYSFIFLIKFLSYDEDRRVFHMDGMLGVFLYKVIALLNLKELQYI
jgi:hypothetical protein